MANEGTDIITYGTFNYRLIFKNKITAPAKNLEELTLEQGTDVKLTEKKNVYLLTLQNVNVIKKIYQPVEIEAELDFMQLASIESSSAENKAPSFKAVSALLLQRQVELRVYLNNSEDYFTLAENCYVYELKPQLKVDVKGTRMNVKLSIFSMDKRMTLNKYSKAYVARKLGSGILKPESLEFGLNADGKSPLVETDITNQIHLIYPDQSTGSDTLERIQPYLVQYNESFYDFLVRTSNRCGEFLYFEDGMLTLGLPLTVEKQKDPNDNTEKIVKKKPVTIPKFESVVIQEVGTDPLIVNDYVRDSMKDGFQIGDLNHSVIKKLDNGFPKDAFPGQLSRNAELSNDEYNFLLTKDKFSSLKREALYDKPIYKTMNGLKAIMTGEELVGSVIGLGVQEGLLAMGSNSQAGNTNKAMQKNNIEPYSEKKEQTRGGTDVVQFASINDKGWITNQFYNDIHQKETEQGRQIICIDMGTAFVPVKLGQKIRVNGLDGNYIIIEIQNTSEDYANGHAGRRQQTICAIPTVGDGENETYYPPVQPVPVIRKSGPQTAFVTDNNDPKYQGRVRVAFPWQTLKEVLKNQLEETSQSLVQTEEEKKKLTSGMRQMKLEVWDAIEKLYALINFVKASPAERKLQLDAKKAEIETLERQIEKRTREKTMEKNKELPPLDDPTKSDLCSEVNNQTVKELESEIKFKKEKLALKKAELEELEKAAKEHDDKKDIEGYVVEKDNSVVKAKWDACERLYHDKYEASYEKLKSLEKDEKTQKSQKEEIKKVLDKNIIEASTPWIRVAQPMATPGGGTYFKPQVGDEVLINFDNDNVERPYVVGSLYSKNNLDPFESFERKGAPTIQFGTGKQVSMSIMSPNGHHITFSDPKDGNKFVYGLNPGTKFWLPMFPIPGLPNSKELAGGIHIGDRYGVYEIEMCTHDRAISIKSPLGTVDISAFTGITISAPNGDVTIKGKNVNIVAGNKVSITSGNNIKPPGIGDPDYRCGSPVWKKLKGWWGVPRFFANIGRGIRFGALYLGHQIMAAAPAAISNELGPAAFADLSLLRHVFEVAVKPVDGTMLIKSKRYLKLEAGSGTAKIKADRFNGSKKIDSQEKFYERLIATLKKCNDTITGFYDKYKTLWDAAMFAKMDYTDVATAFLKEPDVDDITKKIWGYEKDFDFKPDDFMGKLKSDAERFKEGDILFKGSTFKTTEEKAEFVNLKATIYAEAAFRYHVHAITFKDLLKDFKDDDTFEGSAKFAFSFVAVPAQEKWEQLYGNTEPTGDFADWAEEVFVKKDAEALVKRETAARYLLLVADSDENKEGKFLSLGFDESDITEKKIKTDYNWKNFMTHYEKHLFSTHGNKALIYLFDGLVKSTMERWKNPFGAKKENEIWAAGKGGQILFSDNDGATLHIENESLKSESQSNLGNRDQLLKLLLSIK